MSLFADAIRSHTGNSRNLPVVAFADWNERVKSAALAFQGSEIDRRKRFPSTKIQSTFDRIARVGALPKAGEKEATW